MTTRTYRLPPAFYEDHRSRDNGETGRIIGETKRHTIAELDAQAWLDLHSDATLYSEYTVRDLGPEFFGLIASAKATLRALEADRFSDDELADGKRRWNEAQAALVAENAERRAAADARRAEEQAAREAERLAHPRLRTTYESMTRSIFGLVDDTDLRVGAILVTSNLAQYEVIEVGDEHRGDVPVTLRAQDGSTTSGRIELQQVRR